MTCTCRVRSRAAGCRGEDSPAISNINVYGFTKPFVWKIHLLGLPPDAVFEEERQRYVCHRSRPTVLLLGLVTFSVLEGRPLILSRDPHRLAHKARTQLEWSSQERIARVLEFEAIQHFRDDITKKRDSENEAQRNERIARLDDIMEKKYQASDFEKKRG